MDARAFFVQVCRLQVINTTIVLHGGQESNIEIILLIERIVFTEK